MSKGEFLHSFFTERDGSLVNPNSEGEIAVLCPFPHDNGFETRASAHINLSRGVFHCKVCEAENRFDGGGLSETNFVSKFYKMPYATAVKYVNMLSPDEADDDSEEWSRAIDNLLASTDDMAYLAGRGISKKTVKEYGLGYMGSGIAYPVRINGVLMDVRTYNPNPTPDDPAKIKSRSGTHGAYIFPFDHWKDDKRPTIFCAGENDALLAREQGFNAITGTGGEGRFPEMFAPLFKDKLVYMCYDGDSAGRKGGANGAFILKQAGADVYMIDLGLTNTKDDKDITDFFIKRGFTAADFQKKIDSAVPFTKEEETKVKNIKYPLVDLWRVIEGQNHGKRISSRVNLAGVYDQGMKVPVAIEWKCDGARTDKAGKSPCNTCPVANGNGLWIMDEDLRETLKLVEVNDVEQRKVMRSLCDIPDKCPNSTMKSVATEPVYKVIFTPDVDSLNEGAGTKLVEMYAYTVGLNTELEDGNKYRAFFRTYAHPKDQRTFMVVDRLEESDNSVNAFKMNEHINESLQIFKGNPFDMMADRAKRMHSLTVYFKPPKLIADAYNISFHSVLEFNFQGRVMKGYPEILIVGESRIGKTETGKTFQNYIRLGNTTNVKNASIAGLLGGADSLPSGGWKINWGSVPRNHRGMLILDEMSGLHRDVISKMTDMRSEGIATVEKIAKGKAPAKTRLVWAGNPKTINGVSRKISDYANGVSLILDLIGADEDVARFDACMVLESDEASSNQKPELPMHDAQLYRDLVCWAWSRTADQVVFATGAEDYIHQQADTLNDKYDSHVKFLGKEAWKKIARVAVACAASCYSCTDDWESVLVKKEHVDWAVDFFVRCYDNPTFRLRDYAQKQKTLSETNEVINTMVAGICKTNMALIQQLLEANSHITPANLMLMSGIERQKFSELLAKMLRASLVQSDASKGLLPTTRLRKAVAAYRAYEKDEDMIPLNEKDAIL